MPIQYKTYGCKFKCGWNHHSNVKKIEKHENVCWGNVKNKTCLTCKNGIITHDSCDYEEGLTAHLHYRECGIDSELEFDEVIPKINCEKWEFKI